MMLESTMCSRILQHIDVVVTDSLWICQKVQLDNQYTCMLMVLNNAGNLVECQIKDVSLLRFGGTQYLASQGW